MHIRIEMGLLLLMLLAAAGCGPSTEAESTEVSAKSVGEMADTVTAAEETAGLAELERLGLELEEVLPSADTFDFRNTDLTDEIAAVLAEANTGAKKLTLGPHRLTENGWRSLSQLGTLEHLDLRATKVSNSELAILLSGMPKLRSLKMSGKSGETSVDDAGLAALSNCKALKVLAVDHLWVGADGVASMLGCPELSEVYLASTLVDDLAVKELAKLERLEKLRLAQTSVGDAGLAALSGLALTELDISECSQVSDESLMHVGKITTLQRLNLWRDTVSDAGVAYLAPLTELKWLNLDNTHVTDEGLSSLSGMQKLIFLHLGSTAITDNGLPALKVLTSLMDLKVTRTSVTADAVAKLQESLPNTAIQLKYIEGQ